MVHLGCLAATLTKIWNTLWQMSHRCCPPDLLIYSTDSNWLNLARALSSATLVLLTPKQVNLASFGSGIGSPWAWAAKIGSSVGQSRKAQHALSIAVQVAMPLSSESSDSGQFLNSTEFINKSSWNCQICGEHICRQSVACQWLPHWAPLRVSIFWYIQEQRGWGSPNSQPSWLMQLGINSTTWQTHIFCSVEISNKYITHRPAMTRSSWPIRIPLKWPRTNANLQMAWPSAHAGCSQEFVHLDPGLATWDLDLQRLWSQSTSTNWEILVGWCCICVFSTSRAKLWTTSRSVSSIKALVMSAPTDLRGSSFPAGHR